MIAGVVVLTTWALLVVLARRLPPGAARDLATVLPACATTARALRRDPRVPRAAKVAVLIALLWVLSPIDLIPEEVIRLQDTVELPAWVPRAPSPKLTPTGRQLPVAPPSATPPAHRWLNSACAWGS